MKNLKSKIGLIILILFLFNTISLLADDDIVFIPDSAFKAVLLNHWPTIDTNEDGEIQVSEAESFDPAGEPLDAYGDGVHDLTGIKAFKNVNTIITGGELITEIDISGMDKMYGFECHYSNITELSLEGCTGLTRLQCNNNSKLTSIDVNDCVDLRILDCKKNNIEYLDLTKNIYLEQIFSYDNQITNIHIPSSPNVYRLYTWENKLIELNASNLPILPWVACSNNHLTNIKLPNASLINKVSCNNNKIDKLDCSNLLSLSAIELSNNSLTILNLKNGNNNNITDIDVLNNPNLKCVDVDIPSYSYANWLENFDEGIDFSEDCNESITEIQNKSFFVFPNPANNNITIKRLSSSQSEIKIIDMTGKLCYKEMLQNGEEEIQIDISKFAIGTYIIEIENESELIIIER